MSLRRFIIAEHTSKFERPVIKTDTLDLRQDSR